MLVRKTRKLTFLTNELGTLDSSPQRHRKLVFPSKGTSSGALELFLFLEVSDGNISQGVFKGQK